MSISASKKLEGNQSLSIALSPSAFVDGLRESTIEVLGVPPVYTLPKDVGIYLEFLRTMSSFRMENAEIIQNDWSRRGLASLPGYLIPPYLV